MYDDDDDLLAQTAGTVTSHSILLLSIKYVQFIYSASAWWTQQDKERKIDRKKERFEA